MAWMQMIQSARSVLRKTQPFSTPSLARFYSKPAPYAGNRLFHFDFASSRMYRFVTSELLKLRMLVEIISGFSLFSVFIIKRNHFYQSCVYSFIFIDCSLQRHLLDHIGLLDLIILWCFCSEGWDSRVLEWDWWRSWDPCCQAWNWVRWSFETARDSYPQAQEVWHPLQTCKLSRLCSALRFT